MPVADLCPEGKGVPHLEWPATPDAHRGDRGGENLQLEDCRFGATLSRDERAARGELQLSCALRMRCPFRSSTTAAIVAVSPTRNPACGAIESDAGRLEPVGSAEAPCTEIAALSRHSPLAATTSARPGLMA